jgi:pumilio RNA-binding family
MNDPSMLGVGGYHMDTLEMQKNHIFGYPIDQKNQYSRTGSYGMPMGNKSNSLSPAYYGSPPGVGFVMPYGSSPVSSPVLPGSPLAPSGFSMRQGDHNLRFPSSGSSGRSTSAGSYNTNWQGQKTSDSGEEPKGSSLLEELKNNKTRRFELADIVGHVLEFRYNKFVTSVCTCVLFWVLFVVIDCKMSCSVRISMEAGLSSRSWRQSRWLRRHLFSKKSYPMP